jgi:tRNA(His) 5'-end guanylyltransferase
MDSRAVYALEATGLRDSLGDRLKANYEDRTRYYLPRRTYTIVRVDGKAFHSYTRDLVRPFDTGLAADLDLVARALCEQCQGSQFAFVQSDEVSVLLTDFAEAGSEAWFDGNLQKIVSVAASVATGTFNAARLERLGSGTTWSALPPPAYFDARAFTIPDPIEVENYFIWRQQDATRNSISMAAQAHFSSKQLHGKSTDQLQELLWSEHQVNWNDYPAGFKRGRVVVKVQTRANLVYTDKRTGEQRLAENVERSTWEVVAPPVFTRERSWLSSRIPRVV